MKLLTAFLLAISLCGCSGPEHVSVADFKDQYYWVGKAQTVRDVVYLGQRDGRAYIRVSTMSTVSQKWSEQIIYVELSELDPAFRAALPATQMGDTK
jgi:hypothetical protein